MKRHSALAIIALLSVIAILLLYLTLPAFSSSSRPLNRSEMPRTLNVTGTGFVDIPQTLAQVQLGVETQKETAITAQTDIAQRSTDIVQLLQKNAKVTKLSTAGVRLNPIYTNQNGQQTVTGYRGSNVVRIQIAPADISGLLDEAVDAGASRIDGVTLVAAEDAIAKAQDEAIAIATDQAQHQVKAALGALNLKPEEVINIQINGAGQDTHSIDASYFQTLSSSALVKQTPIIAGEQRISAAVTLQVRD